MKREPLPFGLEEQVPAMAQLLSDDIDRRCAESIYAEFQESLTRADFATLGKDAPVLVQRSGPFRGRVYQRTLTGGIVRVK